MYSFRLFQEVKRCYNEPYRCYQMSGGVNIHHQSHPNMKTFISYVFQCLTATSTTNQLLILIIKSAADWTPLPWLPGTRVTKVRNWPVEKIWLGFGKSVPQKLCIRGYNSDGPSYICILAGYVSQLTFTKAKIKLYSFTFKWWDIWSLKLLVQKIFILYLISTHFQEARICVSVSMLLQNLWFGF